MKSIINRNILNISLFVVLITGGIAYKEWDYSLFSPITYFIYLIIYIYCIVHLKSINFSKLILGKSIIFLALLPLLSIISLILWGKEGISHSIRYMLEPSVLLVYFILLYKRIHRDTVIKFMLLWGSIICCIFIIQQIFPDRAIFGVFNDEQIKELDISYNVAKRNDLYRFRLDAFFYVSYFCCFYSWDKLLHKPSFTNLLVFTFYLVAIYLYLARQILAIFVFVASLLLILNKFKLKVIIPLIILITIIYLYGNMLFSALIESTKDDLSGDYIRYFSYNFFWSKSIDNPIAFLIGNGHMPILESLWKKNYSVYASDVGIIGALYYYGIIWVVVYLHMFYLIFKQIRNLPQYLSSFYIAIFINSIFIIPTERSSHMLFLALALFLLEKQLTPNKENNQNRIYINHKL